MNKVKRKRLLSALEEIESICKAQPKCDTSCPFSHPVKHYCEIYGFVDDFADWHLHDEVSE